MPKKKSPGTRAVAPAKNTNLAKRPERIAIAGTEIRPEQVYVVKDHRPRVPGPWSEEPIDKLAWRDAETGLDCILLRQPSGVWGGYVAVAPGHPLYGYREDAIPGAANLDPHGGVDYAQQCSRAGPEETQVCHVRSYGHTGPTAADQAMDHAWWFGFAADKPGDLVPGSSKPVLAREEGETYRTIDYMYSETTRLACQLKDMDGSASIDANPKLGQPLPRLGKPEER